MHASRQALADWHADDRHVERPMSARGPFTLVRRTERRQPLRMALRTSTMSRAAEWQASTASRPAAAVLRCAVLAASGRRASTAG
jgi:hypothetical protein